MNQSKSCGVKIRDAYYESEYILWLAENNPIHDVIVYNNQTCSCTGRWLGTIDPFIGYDGNSNGSFNNF